MILFYVINSDTILVKLNDDGVVVGRCHHHVNFTGTILNDESIVFWLVGALPLAIIKEKESYNTILEAMNLVSQDSKILQKTVLDISKFGFKQICFCVTGETKYLFYVAGLDSVARYEVFVCVV